MFKFNPFTSNFDITGDGGAWGSITGTLSNQIDLQTALNAKLPYTGATDNVNLGIYTLTSPTIILNTVAGGTKISGAIANQFDISNVGGTTSLTFKLNSVGASAIYTSNVINTYYRNSSGYGLQIEGTDLSLYSGGTISIRGGGTKYAFLDTTTLATTDKTFTFPNASGTLALGTGTINEISYWAGANTLGTLAVATYPSLTELSYLKGVTSAIQTQLGTKMANPMTTAGDIIYGGASGVPTRLAIGTAAQVLTVNAGATAVEWTAAGAGDMILASVQTVTGAKTFGTIGGAVGKLILAGSTSGSSILNAAAVAGATTITLPNATGILALTDQTMYIGTTAVAINRASAALTLAGITLTTPDIGTPSAGVATNITGLPAAAVLAGSFGAGAFVISTSLQVATLELGHATDTTLSRSAAGVLAVEGVVIPSISSTNTLTNKRITFRTGTTTSSATPTINTDNVEFYSLTAQAEAITSFTTNLSGTPTERQTLWIAITGTAARAITWGTSFEASTVALPTTTVTTARLDVGFVWNTVSGKWRVVAVS